VWPSGTGAELFASTPITADAGFVPNLDGPVLLSWARLRDAGDDLLLSDLDTLRVIRAGGNVGDLDAAAGVDALHPGPPPTPAWGSINGIDPSPIGDCRRDQVVIAENTHAHVLTGDQVDPLGGPEVPVAAITLNTKLADLDGAPPLDLVVSGGVELGAYLRDDTAIVSAAGPTMYDAFMDSYRLDAVAVGELGGSTEPELVAIDNPDGGGTGTPRVILFGGLHVTGALLASDTPSVHNLPGGFVPRDVVIGDLDDDGTTDAWLIGDDGALRCYRRGATLPLLEPC